MGDMMNQVKYLLVIFCAFQFNQYFASADTSTAKLQQENQHRPIVVAIVDTGIDLDNQLFKNYLWRNPGEDGFDQLGRPKESNGIDDDHNGYVDDLHGWNFYDQNANLQDDLGHGTHVTGIISGLSFPTEVLGHNDVKFMILKYYSMKKKQRDTQVASNEALKYALQMGAVIINYSGGGVQFDQNEKEIFQELEKKSIWSVVAAGNTSDNLENSNYYPAKYQLPHMLVVSSMNSKGQKSLFANYGQSVVDLFAVGENIISFGLDQKLMTMTGTSQATAMVTRMIAQQGQKIVQCKTKFQLLLANRNKIRSSQFLISYSRKGEYLETDLKRQVIASEKRIMTRPGSRLKL